jgi:hypothetical protein
VAETQSAGLGRIATRYCYFAHFPFLRSGLYPAGVVDPNLPAHFATFAAYWDFVYRSPGDAGACHCEDASALFGLPALAGQLGAAWAIPIIYVPLLMITHVAAFCLLLRPQHESAPRNRSILS